MKNKLPDATVVARALERAAKGEITEEDRRIIEYWKSEDPKAKMIITRLTTPEIIAEDIKVIKSADATGAATRLRKKMLHRQRQKTLHRIITTVSAAVVATIMLLLFTPGKKDIIITLEKEICAVPQIITSTGKRITIAENNDPVNVNELIMPADTLVSSDSLLQINTLITPPQFFTTVKLEDGTIVHLNAQSKLSFPTVFSTTREVTLSGEAYFEVTHSNQPFIVHAGEISVKVYGTKFNIHMDDSIHINTLLVEGSVGILLDEQEIRLHPDQLCQANVTQGKLTVENVKPEKYLVWMKNQFMCEKDPLPGLARELSRWYGIEVNCDHSVSDIHLTLIYSRQAPITDIFEAIVMLDSTIQIIKTERGYQITKDNNH